MKILNFALALAASLCIFTSCSNETDEIVDVNKDVKVKKVIGVSTQTSVSRTSIVGLNFGSSTQNVHWSNGDELSVFAVGHPVGDTFRFTDYVQGELHNIASFEGYTYKNGDYYLLYPAQSDARLLSDNKMTITIPSKQNAHKGSFDPKANIQLGKGSSLDSPTGLSNVCAHFYITVPGNCTKVTVETDNSNWKLAGPVTVEEITSAGNHICAFGAGCTNKVELNDITEAGTYFISFIPTAGMLTEKLIVTMYTDGPQEVEFTAPTTGGFSFEAGKYYNLGNYIPNP